MGDGGTGGFPIQVFLLSQHVVTAYGLSQMILAETQDMALVGVADTLTQACIQLRGGQAQIVLLDLDTFPAAETIPALLGCGSLRVLALTGVQQASLTDQTILAGASGIIHKNEPLEVLLKAVRRIHAGEVWMDRAAMGRILRSLSQPAEPDPNHQKIARLTRKELQIVKRITDGNSLNNRDMAVSLHISEHTLRNHLSAIYAKLELGNRLELYAFAQRYPITAD